jgi:hypothetical protein
MFHVQCEVITRKFDPVNSLTCVETQQSSEECKGIYRKVKLSPCLIKHNAMKTYWGNGGIAPNIFNLGAR